MSLAEVAIQDVTAGKRHAASVACMSRAIAVVVSVSCQGRPGLVSFVAYVALVHAARCSLKGGGLNGRRRGDALPCVRWRVM
jgi:hypothetical protein